jgi:hypothetical protein
VCRFRRSRASWDDSILSTQSLPKAREAREMESESVCRHAVFLTSDNRSLSEVRGPGRGADLYLATVLVALSAEVLGTRCQTKELGLYHRELPIFGKPCECPHQEGASSALLFAIMSCLIPICNTSAKRPP